MAILLFGLTLIVMLSLLGGSNYYLAHRLWRWMRCFAPNLSIWVPLSLVAALTVMMFLSIARPFGGRLQRIISGIGTCWMGLFVYLLLFFLAADLIVLIVGLFKPQLDLRTAAGMAATALAVLVSLLGIWNATRLHTVNYSVALSEQPTARMNVVLISDVHLGAVGSEARLEKIVDRVNELQPDLVCIAGDFFDNDYRSISDPEKAIETLRRIRSTHGVYACLGNHDAGASYPQMEAFWEQAGIKLLKDDYTVIDGNLILAGRLDPSPIGGTDGSRRGDLSAVLEGADPSLPVIMLDHNPASVDTYEGEADLILSGHTHKGQIFPGALITNAMYTVDYGYYRAENGTQVIVTSGAGTWGLPMRIGTNCEVVAIDLEY